VRGGGEKRVAEITGNTDFEDILFLLAKHDVKYLIVGGLAFSQYARPRNTKDMDLWIESSRENVVRANAALAEFGSPYILDPCHTSEVLQIGVAPNRVDILAEIEGVRFATAWGKRKVKELGSVKANWVDLDTLLRIKSRIKSPRHQEDARVLRDVKKKMKEKTKTKSKKQGRTR
jgi:hypothetical protein